MCILDDMFSVVSFPGTEFFLGIFSAADSPNSTYQRSDSIGLTLDKEPQIKEYCSSTIIKSKRNGSDLNL